jgi:TrmH family RNA methyltransferase
VITSTRNKQVVEAARLKKRGLREQHRRFLVEGAQAAWEALDAGAVETLFHVPGAGGRVREVLRRAQESGVREVAVSDSVIAHVTSTVTPQGIVAVARFVDVAVGDLPQDLGLVPVLCSVRDPGNAGTILRGADASGASAVVFTSASVDVYNSKTVRASAGSLFHVPVAREVPAPEAVGALRHRGAQVLAAEADARHSVYDLDLTRPTAVLFGNEAWGLEPDVRGLADGGVRVPIPGRAESLNLAAAAALVMFEAARQRADHGDAPDLAAVISACAHDLRLPLTAVKGFAATLADRWESFGEEERREMVRGMALDAERAGALVTMIVDAARLSSGRFELSSERRDLAEVATWAGALFGRGSDYPTVEVKGSAETRFDPERLRAVFLALCDGAVWWGRQGPIVIEIRRLGDGAAAEVRRAGGGPTAEELVSMFEGPGGSGSKVPLHIARRVVEAHGGTLTSQGGDGIMFSLTLPG